MKCSVSSFSLIIFSHGDGFGVPVGWCAPSRETHKRTWKKAWCIYSKLKPVSTRESSDRLSVHVQTEHSRETCFKTDRKKSSLILMHAPFVFVRGNNGWQKGHKIINLLKGKMFHVDFHKDLFFIHTQREERNSLPTHRLLDEWRRFIPFIIWICYHVLLHERLRACDARSETGRVRHTRKKVETAQPEHASHPSGKPS